MEGQQQDGARTVKPKAREVKARYLQSKATPSSRVAAGASATGRASLAAYNSTIWTECQVPDYTSTPLMVNTGSLGSTALIQSSHRSAAAGQSTCMPSTAQRRPPYQQLQQPGSAAPQRARRAPAAGGHGEPPAQQLVTPLPAPQQQHSATQSSQHQPGAMLSPGSSRSSTSCSFRAGGEGDGAAPASRQRGSCAGAAGQPAQSLLVTPRLGRLAASLACPGTARQPGRLGMSADVALALQGAARTSVKGADERRAQLEAFRLQKRLQAQGGQQPGQHGGFKEPPPKPTLFTATAAGRGGKPGSSGAAAGEGGGGLTSTTVAAAAAHAQAGHAVLRAQLGSSGGGSCSPAVATSLPPGTAALGSGAEQVPTAPAADHSPGPPSAFRATMATLQQAGSGGKSSRPSAARSGAGSTAVTPAGVPPLQLNHVLDAGPANTPPRTALQQQQQQQRPKQHLAGLSPQRPSAGTKIPRLDFTPLSQQQQQPDVAAGAVPHTSRRVSSAAHVPLPDATPRTARDAPAAASRLPKTPRSVSTAPHREPGCRMGRQACDPGLAPAPPVLDLLQACADASQTPDRQQQQGQRRLQQLQQVKQRPAQLVPVLKLGALVAAAGAAADDGPSACGRSRAAVLPPPGSMSARHASPPLSSRLAGTALATSRPPSSRGTPPAGSKLVAATARQLLSGTAGSLTAAPPADSSRALAGKTPRGLCGLGAAVAAAVGAVGGSQTPRVRDSGSNGAPSGIRSEPEQAEDVRQQLRLLRVQHMQFRHLNARVSAAVRTRQHKAEKTVAAAASAVISLSQQLAAANQADHTQQWHNELRGLLARQLPQLQQWAAAQAGQLSSMAALQRATEGALSHVPLLNGAMLGGCPEAPDLDLMQALLARISETLTASQPALQRLMGPDLGTAAATTTTTSSSGGRSQGPAGQQPAPDQQLQQATTRRSLRSTAVLAQQLMGVAREELKLLEELNERLDELCRLHLYANSMQVQLLQMKEAAEAAAAEDEGGGGFMS